MKLYLVVTVVAAAAVSAASAAAAGHNIRPAAQAVQHAAVYPRTRTTNFAPLPSSLLDLVPIVPPPPLPENPPPEPHLPPPPLSPPPPPPPPPPPAPSTSHTEFEIGTSRYQRPSLLPPAARRYVPFATYGPPARSPVSALQYDPNHEFNSISSDWGVPGSLTRSRQPPRVPGRPVQGRVQDRHVPNQEFVEISSDWGVPIGALAKAVEAQRQHKHRHQNEEEPLQEFLEISFDWGVPVGALAKAVEAYRQRSQRRPQDDEEPLQEFNEISSDWSVPSSLITGAQIPAVTQQQVQRRPSSAQLQHRGLQRLQHQLNDEEPLQEFNEISSDWGVPSSLLSDDHSHDRGRLQPQNQQAQPAQQTVPAGQPVVRTPQPQQTLQQPQQTLQQTLRQPQQPQQQIQQTVQQSQQPRQQPRDASDVEGRFVYSHLVDGRLFPSAHRGSPLDLATSPAVKLVGGSFSFVSPDGIPVNIRKIRFH